MMRPFVKNARAYTNFHAAKWVPAFAGMTMMLIAASVSPAFAVQPGEILKDPALEARARALSAGLRCLVCQNQSIDDSDAPLARDLRILIRERLTAGETDAQVIGFVVARYGDFVLLKPRLTAKTALLWVAPFAVLLVAALFLFRRRKGAAANEAPLSPEERAEFDHFLHAEELAEQSAASLEASASGRTLRGPASPGTSG